MEDKPVLTPAQVVVPAATPTAGALLGSLVGSWAASRVGVDPLTQTTVISTIVTLFTWVFHIANKKLGTPT